MQKYYIKTAKTALILVYLVIIAGALVRMTGSGMGCPDWPKCFGYYIPPTDIKQLLWQPQHQYLENQVIIKDEKLYVAVANFKTQTTFDQTQWRPYTKHDYAIFNAKHTWIEYLNRLAGALAGIVVFLMAVCSFGFWKTNKKVTIWSWITVILMGFQGWLGAKVVYSVLNPIKITLHTFVALLIVAVMLSAIDAAKKQVFQHENNILFKKILILSIFLTLIQIILGTQVRQFVDDQIKMLGYDQMHIILEHPTITFYIHRTLSMLVLFSTIYLYIQNKSFAVQLKLVNWIMLAVVFEALSGIIITYLHFPFASQPVHLVFASVLFGLQYQLAIQLIKK